MPTHFFEDRGLATRVRDALIARGTECGELTVRVKSPLRHCCADDCCGQSPCRYSTPGVEFTSPLKQREVHTVALANGGRHVFRGSRCRFCGVRRSSGQDPRWIFG